MRKKQVWAGVLLLTGFAAVTAQVLTSGPLTGLDWAVHRLVQDYVDGRWRQVADALAHAGHRVVLTVPLGVLCVLAAARFRSFRPMMVVFAVCATLVIVVPGIKIVTGRAAPQIQHDWLFAPGTSFPSGHAANAVVLWGALLELARSAARRVETLLRPWLVYTLIAVAAAAAGLGKVGVGDHWLTDVLAGWLLGTAMYVALLAWDPFRPLRERRGRPTSPSVTLTRPTRPPSHARLEHPQSFVETDTPNGSPGTRGSAIRSLRLPLYRREDRGVRSSLLRWIAEGDDSVPSTRGSGRRESVSRWRLRFFWKSLSNAFWFIPALLTAGAVALFALTWFSSQFFAGKPAGVPLILDSGPTGARALLAAVMTGFISVAGTVFSVTILILQLFSSQFSPRLLPRNLIGDRGAQVVLGIYLGMAVYCILGMLATSTTGQNRPTAFSTLAAAGGVFWALMCAGALTYFLAHVATLIQSSSAVQSAQDQALTRIASLRDQEGDHRAEHPPTVLADYLSPGGLLAREPTVLRAAKSGYLQVVNAEVITGALMNSAGGDLREIAVDVPYGPGDYVAAGMALAKIWPAAVLPSGSDSRKAVYKAFVLGRERSFDQDFAFGLRQLSDIALKGVSNDPANALQALDRMETIFVALGKKTFPPRYQERNGKGVRVVLGINHYDFSGVVEMAFDQIRRASFDSGQVAVLKRMLEVIGTAIEENDAADRRAALWRRAMDVARQAPSQVPDPHDATDILLHGVTIGGLLLSKERRSEVGDDLERLSSLSEDLAGGEKVREAVQAVREAG